MTNRLRPALTLAARVAATLALACAGASVALARHETGGQQLDLDAVLARPAGRAVDVAQPPPVVDAESGRRTGGRRGRVGHGRWLRWTAASLAP